MLMLSDDRLYAVSAWKERLSMNLRSLRYFAAVVQAGSFTEASRRLNIAQPAVSRQIQNLEGEFGVSLLIRSRRRVEPTGAGRYLLERAMPLLLELDRAKSVISAQSKAHVGDLVIGLTTGEGLTFASTLLQKWREMFPAAKLTILEGLAPLIFSGMRAGTIHVGIAPEPLAFDGIWTRRLFKEALVLIAPTETAAGLPSLGETGRLTMPDLMRLPLIAPSEPNPLRRQIAMISARHGVPAHISAEIDSMSIIKDLVSRGLGYALTTHAHIARELEHGVLRVVPLASPELERHVSLFGLREGAEQAADARTADFLERLVLDTVDAGLWPGAFEHSD